MIQYSLFCAGVPYHESTLRAVPHLRQLLYAAIRQFLERCKSQGTTLDLSLEQIYQLPLVVVGFSKGCVVLNQIVHELPNYFPMPSKQDIDPKASSSNGGEGRDSGLEERLFLERIKSIYWLDSGHSGDKEAWITATPLLQCLSQVGAEIHVHVSPHQVCCPSRPWIGEEKREFVRQLREMQVKVVDTLHFGDQPRSFEYHFKILNEF